MTVSEQLNSVITDVHDFPQPGIIFKDITSIFQHPDVCKSALKSMADHYRNRQIDCVAALESRGFLFGFPLAMELNVPFVLIRKKGKLPRETHAVSYALEYGHAVIEVHKDAFTPGQNVLIHDDVLATGGTAAAAAQLVLLSKARIAGFSFLLELNFLNGRQKLAQFGAGVFTLAAH
jgi:adenine phosphoribosyltransferase